MRKHEQYIEEEASCPRSLREVKGEYTSLFVFYFWATEYLGLFKLSLYYGCLDLSKQLGVSGHHSANPVCQLTDGWFWVHDWDILRISSQILRISERTTRLHDYGRAEKNKISLSCETSFLVSRSSLQVSWTLLPAGSKLVLRPLADGTPRCVTPSKGHQGTSKVYWWCCAARSLTDIDIHKRHKKQIWQTICKWKAMSCASEKEKEGQKQT